MRRMRSFLNRRRGAGMTEYIIIVGMIAILLVTAVERYKTQIEVTIVGTDAAFDKANVGGGPNGVNPPKPGDTRQKPGSPGKTQHWNGNTWVDD